MKTGLYDFFQDNPILLLPVLGLLVVLALGPRLAERLHQHLEQAKARKRKRAQDTALIDELRQARDSDAFYEIVGKVLRGVDPDKSLPNRAALDQLIETAWLADTIFHFNSVDWYAAHGTPDDYDALVAALAPLGLSDMRDPVEAAQAFHTRIHAMSGAEIDAADCDAQTAESDAIGQAFAAKGGACRVREAVHKALKMELAPLLQPEPS